MGKYFGTDGVRGVANRELTPELAFRIGRCGAHVLAKDAKKPKVVIGRDPRISGQMLEAALVAGLLSIGAEVIRLGVITTPGVAYLTRALGADAGIVISASHNPVADNGIKFFGPDGFKLSDDMEAAIEQLLDEPEDRLPRPVGGDVGRVEDFLQGGQKYLQYLKTTVNTRFEGLRIVLDCANGAASFLAPQLFVDLGAEVTTIAATPNGVNINEGCGSTHPERLQEEVVRQKADLGLAFDGDADRVIAVDEKGNVVDGDFIMAILAKALKERGALKGDAVVATVMSNIGFHRALEEMGLRVEVTAVGDRHVMEAMRKGGYNLGGEQSGHIILLDYATTGDGLLTALQLTSVVAASGKPLSKLASLMRKYPQVLRNVRVANKHAWADNAAVQAAIREAEAALGSSGRVLVRPSGTEPLVRVMVEGPDEETIQAWAARIADTLQRELG
ncbi:phosphoglucosamine mutase [Calditerricola satsumensis]|uniref:Phosphoglucosamine mutase n=1 Tax=Calditerricola satsumensis TaxID=373054 RepID=A0A8J3FBZ8_9BACI|nr:phosphoglucosamine mutase [Calditerricola satsumensis]GGJ98100.1 phosphoglucosamine mutase [Calditerricola satsumensis]